MRENASIFFIYEQLIKFFPKFARIKFFWNILIGKIINTIFSRHLSAYLLSHLIGFIWKIDKVFWYGAMVVLKTDIGSDVDFFHIQNS